MTKVLVATDADWVWNEVEAALDEDDAPVARVRAGEHVLGAAQTLQPALVLLDLQIGNMGGFAAATLLRQEIEAERLKPTRIVLLLDRAADVFLARTAGVDGWLVKPLDAFRLERAAASVLAGEGWSENPRPAPTTPTG